MDRLSALEERVSRLENLEAIEPVDILTEWIADTEKMAFKLLLQELELHVEGFSLAAFRETFRDIARRSAAAGVSAGSNERSKQAAERLVEVFNARLEEIISDLIPPSIYE